MTQLADILNQIAEVLNSLESVMHAEQQQLCAGQVHGSTLQRITEDKSSLLATLDYLDALRQVAQKNAAAPLPELETRWQAMGQQIKRLSHINQHSGWLLESQQAHTEQALAILKPYQAPEFYGADGQAKSGNHHGNKKVSY